MTYSAARLLTNSRHDTNLPLIRLMLYPTVVTLHFIHRQRLLPAAAAGAWRRFPRSSRCVANEASMCASQT